MAALPKRQKEILEFIRRRIEDEGAPPTFQEIADRFRIQIPTVQEHLAALERKGVIEKTKNRARGIRLVQSEAFTPRSIPILGATTAGRPELAIENHEGRLAVDGSLVRGENVFALKVKGDSMVEAGILDGDYVIVRSQPRVENGEIGVVAVDNEATVKRLFVSDRRIRLVAENPAYEALEFDLETNKNRRFTPLGKQPARQ